MHWKFSNYEDDTDVVSKVEKINQGIKKSFFSDYIWKHDIHSLKRTLDPKIRVSELKEELQKELNLITSKSQATFERHFGSDYKKKPKDPQIDEEEEEKTRGKPGRKKNNNIEKLSSNFERIDKIVTQKKPEKLVNEIVEEVSKEARVRREGDLNKYQEIYNDLFSSGKQELPVLTTRKNNELIEKIQGIQRELRPNVYKLPVLQENISKVGVKVKQAKVMYR